VVKSCLVVNCKPTNENLEFGKFIPITCNLGVFLMFVMPLQSGFQPGPNWGSSKCFPDPLASGEKLCCLVPKYLTSFWPVSEIFSS